MAKSNYTLKYVPAARLLEVGLPASKSISNRALLMAALAGESGRLDNVARCDDTDAMQSALLSDADTVDIGAAGTAMRFLTSFFAARQGRTVTLDGSPRMRRRPIGILVDALRNCGAQIDYTGNDGFPPLKITGRQLRADNPVRLAGNVSSQFVSSLMMIAPTMEGGLTILIVGEPISLPYVRMTQALMRHFGADVEIDGAEIRIGQSPYRPVPLRVESDWSAASYWYELKSLAPDLQIRLKGLQKDSLQGDCKVAEIFRELGVTTEFSAGDAILHRAGCLPERLDLDLSGEPDLTQTLAVTACLKGIPFCFKGLSTLKIKETDRLAALSSQLRKLGYVVTEQGGNTLSWDGSRCKAEERPAIETFDDHRMAMAFAPAAVMAGGLTVCDAGVVAKSYPDYWKHLADAGFEWEVTE